MRALNAKEQGELKFWVERVHGSAYRSNLGGNYSQSWRQGAVGRLKFFKEQIQEIAAVEAGAWAEVGCGPYPVLAHAAECSIAIMIDPFIKHYFHNRLM